MLDQVSRPAGPAQDTEISRGLLAQMDEVLVIPSIAGGCS